LEEEVVFFPGGSGLAPDKNLGPKCCVVSAAKTAVMIDCGIEFLSWPKGTSKSLKKKFRRKTVGPDLEILGSTKIKGVLLTHPHADHVAALPLAVKYLSKRAEICASPHTADLLGKILQETEELSPYLYYENRGYGHLDVAEALNRVKKIEKPGENKIAGLPAYVGLAGHVPGACYFILKLPSGKKILDLGDICWHDQPTVKGSLFPDDVPDEWLPDIITGTDLTYPVIRPSFDWEQEAGKLACRIRAALSRKKTVILAALRFDRGSNLAISLARRGITVYVDGGIRQVFKILKKNACWSNRLPNVSFIRNRNIRKVESTRHREELAENPSPKVIITTSGMGDGGPVEFYLRYGLPKKRFLFLTSCYLPEGSRFFDLLALQKRGVKEVKMEVNGKREKIHFLAEIEPWRFMAHGYLSELALALAKLMCRKGQKIEKIFLTCGTRKGKKQAKDLLKPFCREVIPVQRGDVYIL
jgi:Cft2 family RNA processing exonuclease